MREIDKFVEAGELFTMIQIMVESPHDPMGHVAQCGKRMPMNKEETKFALSFQGWRMNGLNMAVRLDPSRDGILITVLVPRE